MSKYKKTIGPSNNSYSPFTYCLSIQPRKEEETQWENTPLNMDRKNKTFEILSSIMLHSMITNPQQWFEIVECLLTKKLWWRYLLLVLKMRSRVEQWNHHAQAPWYSAYGSQCSWLFEFELDQWRFEWWFDCHNIWQWKILIRTHILQVSLATTNIE